MSIPYSRYIFGSLPWYGVLIVCGIVAAITLCIHEEKRLSLKPDTVIDAAFWVIPCGIIGARLYYVAFQWEIFAPDPMSILRLWEGGLAIYGGVLGGLIHSLGGILLNGLVSMKLIVDVHVLDDVSGAGVADAPGGSVADGAGICQEIHSVACYPAKCAQPVSRLAHKIADDSLSSLRHIRNINSGFVRDVARDG